MHVARILLAILYMLMALGQAITFGVFTEALATYRAAGEWAPLLAAIVIVVEVAAGVGLLLPGQVRRRAAAVSVGVAVFWAVMAVQAFARGLEVPNCGCFGAYLSQELRWWVLLEDAYLVGLAGWVLRGVTRGEPDTPARDLGSLDLRTPDERLATPEGAELTG